MGDGEFEMDLSLLVEAQLQSDSVTIFVLDNGELGLVSQTQRDLFGRTLVEKQNGVEYSKLGKAFENVHSKRVETPTEVKTAAKTALQSDNISLIVIGIEEELDNELVDIHQLPTLDGT
jgi:thiamine pyrophosphate-dependent acetolactate synthase large subunit-like protein